MISRDGWWVIGGVRPGRSDRQQSSMSRTVVVCSSTSCCSPCYACMLSLSPSKRYHILTIALLHPAQDHHDQFHPSSEKAPSLAVRRVCLDAASSTNISHDECLTSLSSGGQDNWQLVFTLLCPCLALQRIRRLKSFKVHDRGRNQRGKARMGVHENGSRALFIALATDIIRIRE